MDEANRGGPGNHERGVDRVVHEESFSHNLHDDHTTDEAGNRVSRGTRNHAASNNEVLVGGKKELRSVYIRQIYRLLMEDPPREVKMIAMGGALQRAVETWENYLQKGCVLKQIETGMGWMENGVAVGPSPGRTILKYTFIRDTEKECLLPQRLRPNVTIFMDRTTEILGPFTPPPGNAFLERERAIKRGDLQLNKKMKEQVQGAVVPIPDFMLPGQGSCQKNS